MNYAATIHIVNDMECAIECKSTDRIKPQYLKGLRELKKDHPEVRKTVIVSMDKHNRETEDDILILNYNTFIEYLWNGKLF